MARTPRSRGSKRSEHPAGFSEPAQPMLVDDSGGRAASWAGPVIRALSAEAEREGLMAGEKSQHITFRAPPALVEAAKRNLGVTSTSELGMIALMLMAHTDPAWAVMKRTAGALGEDHTLEF